MHVAYMLLAWPVLLRKRDFASYCTWPLLFANTSEATMAPSAVYSQAQAAAIKAGKKRKRDELKPAVQEEEEIASLDGESEQDEDSDEEASGSEQDDDDDDEDEAGADASAMSVFSDIEPKFSNGKGKQREVAKSDNGKVFKQKTLILCSRGITHRMRHMMKDLGALLPHSKTGTSQPASLCSLG